MNANKFIIAMNYGYGIKEWKRQWSEYPVNIINKRNEQIENFIKSLSLPLEISMTEPNPRVTKLNKAANPIIKMPSMLRYSNPDSFYKNLFHEVMHYVGIELGYMDPFLNMLIDQEYAKEEMVAEIGSIIMLHRFNVLSLEQFENSMSYILEYSNHIKWESKTVLINNAYKQAEKRVNIILYPI